MSCETDFETLSAHVDGELDEAAAQEVAAHLAECEACQATVRRLKATKHAVSRLPGRREPTEALRARVNAMRFEATDAAPPLWKRRSLAAVVAVVLAVGLAALGLWWHGGEQPSGWATMLVDDHLHSVPAAKPADVTSDDPETVRAFFESRVDFAPVVPRLGDSRLIGGRLCTLDGERVQLLFYERDGQVLSLFVSGQGAFPETCAESKGHNVCVRKKGDHAFMMVGALDAETLRSTLASL